MCPIFVGSGKILVSLMVTLFSEKVLISTRYIDVLHNQKILDGLCTGLTVSNPQSIFQRNNQLLRSEKKEYIYSGANGKKFRQGVITSSM